MEKIFYSQCKSMFNSEIEQNDLDFLRKHFPDGKVISAGKKLGLKATEKQIENLLLSADLVIVPEYNRCLSKEVFEQAELAKNAYIDLQCLRKIDGKYCLEDVGFLIPSGYTLNDYGFVCPCPDCSHK